LRREIEPVTAAEFWRFLACWQHADPAFRLEGPRGLLEVARKLAGFEIPAAEWESGALRVRLHDLGMEWLDQLTLTGELVWGRLWSGGNSAIRSTPICLLPREDLDNWLASRHGAARASVTMVRSRPTRASFSTRSMRAAPASRRSWRGRLACCPPISRWGSCSSSARGS
jgi:ATP-dependent Lhr-like helicase